MDLSINTSNSVAARWTALTDEVRRRLGTGLPLDASQRAAFPHLAPPPRAYVHRTPIGGRLARAFDASAVAIGEHIIGDAADLEPGSRQGAALLAHEFTHVAHATGGSDVFIQRSVAGSGDEQEAAAQQAEAAVLVASNPTSTSEAQGLDLDELTERVYRRIVNTLVVERERAAQVA